MDFHWPGEKLVIKLWETLAEKGVGSLLSPWHTRRQGRASADARAHEMLVLAQTEKHIAEIRAGRMQYDGQQLLETKPQLPLLELVPKQDDFALALPALAKKGAEIRLLDDASAEINVAKAVLFAEQQLESDGTDVPEEPIDDDWLRSWRDHAGRCSREDMQRLWGALLAGELKEPGRYSLRAMDLLRTISKEEAALIERLAPFVVNDSIVLREVAAFKKALSLDDLMSLQDLGILGGVEALGLATSYTSQSKDAFLMYIAVCRTKVLRFTGPDATRKVELGTYIVTRLGRQILSLGNFEPDMDYVRQIGLALGAGTTHMPLGPLGMDLQFGRMAVPSGPLNVSIFDAVYSGSGSGFTVANEEVLFTIDSGNAPTAETAQA